MTLDEKNKVLREYGLGKGTSLKDSYYTREKHSYYYHYFRKTVVDYMKGHYPKADALKFLDYLKDIYEEDYKDGPQDLAPHNQFTNEYDSAKEEIIKYYLP
jgi:hypothetical protein